ncbi:MAG TPA: S8 family serine peptidase [Candidatus Saccharimonadales bacterium]|nr:S8 family serine peptidase [Candidatus Saccharimonadales bacterium]
MKKTCCLRTIPILLFLLAVIPMAVPVQASNLDTIGVTLLRMVTNVDGTGIRVAQPEASSTNDPPDFEVNPANGSVQQPIGLFIYISNNVSTNYFPNNLGTESGHADTVALYFYGLPGGVATNIARVDNYYADYFVQVSAIETPLTTNYTVSLPSSNIDDPIVNQSFIFAEADGSSAPINEQEAIDSAYDNYAAQYNTLFVSGAGNGTPVYVSPPSTCYNGICVGAYFDGINYSSIGPTLDNGRAKPDITAPETVTSFSTPQVAGAAALLMQAGLRGDGGSDTNADDDIRTVKALLLNGAIKPADWTNNPPSPLDPRYGAGVLNVFNSYEQLAGGEHGYIATTSVPASDAHPPNGASGTIGTLSGWDFNTNTSGSSSDTVNHYYFDVTNSGDNATFAAAATLVWNRQQNQTDINNLNLFLYNAANSNLVACSTSLVDNVEHIWVPQLPQGRYDLQVWKAGGIPDATIVSSAETYALAWEFFCTSLNVAQSDTNVVLTWPIYPDGFVVQSATNLVPPVVWNTLNVTPIVTSNQNQVTFATTNTSQFFRLQMQ